jgi:hypothetical protein
LSSATAIVMPVGNGDDRASDRRRGLHATPAARFWVVLDAISGVAAACRRHRRSPPSSLYRFRRCRRYGSARYADDIG